MISRLSFAPQFRGPAFGSSDEQMTVTGPEYPLLKASKTEPPQDDEFFTTTKLGQPHSPFASGQIMAFDAKTGKLKPYKGQKPNPDGGRDDFHLLDRSILRGPKV